MLNWKCMLLIKSNLRNADNLPACVDKLKLEYLILLAWCIKNSILPAFESGW